uniref:DUF1725 domain-containing protein n=1 Tax=Sus scrofa TaxID=9823 RepID=A0A8D0N2X8_PIG
ICFICSRILSKWNQIVSTLFCLTSCTQSNTLKFILFFFGSFLLSKSINLLFGNKILKTFTEKDTCTPVFITALFTIAETWKQTKCPLTDKWIKKMWYIYTMEHYSAIKKKILKTKLMPFAATWMQLEILIISKPERRRQIPLRYHLFVESKIWNR